MVIVIIKVDDDHGRAGQAAAAWPSELLISVSHARVLIGRGYDLRGKGAALRSYTPINLCPGQLSNAPLRIH